VDVIFPPTAIVSSYFTFSPAIALSNVLSNPCASPTASACADRPEGFSRDPCVACVAPSVAGRAPALSAAPPGRGAG
jgi:hypothetical protein